MSIAINIGDLNSAALRSLTSQRCFTKAGLAVNSTSNTYTITVETKQTDDILTATVTGAAGTETAEFTVLVGNATEDAVATAWAAVINGLTDVSATAANHVITVVAAPTTSAFVLTTAVTKTVGDPTTTAVVAETIIGTKGIKTTNTIFFGIDGHTGSQTTQTNVAITGEEIPISSFKWWLVTIDVDGHINTYPGENGINLLPEIPQSEAPIGAFKVATSNAVTFTPGITSLSKAGITDTYYDLSCIPKAGYPA
jgi:hypothetical protein